MTDPTTETARYRKKPIPVEARQVPPSKDGQSGLDLAAWCGGSVSGTYAEPKIFVPTLEGELVARVGDWIVKGTRGEFWPVKGGIFAETYELATEPPTASPTGSVRKQLLAALDFPYCQGLGFETPEGLLAAYDATMRAAEAEPALSPDYVHPECGFHWHGRDGMDIPMRDGQPVCPRCELRRLAAGAQQQPTTETPTPDTDTCRSVDVDGEPVLVRGHGDFTEQDAKYLGEIVRAAKRRYETEHGPAADEDVQRTDRRETIHVLLARLDRCNLTPGECRAIRERVETEIREADTARAVAAGNKRHVQYLYSEFQQAQAAMERVRAAADHLADGTEAGFRAALTVRAALDGTEQPTTTKDSTP